MPNNINDRKINTYRTSVAALSDTPNADGLSGAELKRIFDGRSDEEIKTSINGLIDDLMSASGAGNIGAAAIYEGGAETVAGQLSELRADKVSRDPGDLPSGIDAAKIGPGEVTNAEFNALSGISSNIQGQIDAARKYTDDKVVEIGAGDMAKAVYDTDGDGVVNAADYADAAGVADGLKDIYPSNPNLLDNWYFADPINQRGQTEYTGAGYTIDRWTGSGTGRAVRTNSGFITLKNTQANSGNAWHGQWIENPSGYGGKDVTFSVLYRTSASYAVIEIWSPEGTRSVKLPATNSEWGVYSITYTMPPALTTCRATVYIHESIEGEMDIAAAKLELGTKQTLARKDGSGAWVLIDPPPKKGVELAECQRHQYIPDVSTSGYRMLGMGVATSATAIRVFVSLSAPLRAAPSNSGIVLDNIADVQAVDLSGGATLTASAVSRDGASIGSLACLIFTVEGATVGHIYNCFTKNDCRICLDANL